MSFFDGGTLQIFGQLALAVFLGALIGLEREYQGKSAGLRTYSLVALGSCLFTVISTSGFDAFAGLASYDPTRIAAQVVVGIGFIGGGLIFLKGDIVYGLTTAAGLWTSAALGVAVGVRFYAAAIFTTLLALVILIVLKELEQYIHRDRPDGAHHDLT